MSQQKGLLLIRHQAKLPDTIAASRRLIRYTATFRNNKEGGNAGVLPSANPEYILACILKVSKNQGGFDLLSPLDSSRMLGTWEIVS